MAAKKNGVRPKRVDFQASPKQITAWKKAAEFQHMTLSQWMRSALDESARTRGTK
jgi:uncharacterized protein (DUF1778 family)